MKPRRLAGVALLALALVAIPATARGAGEPTLGGTISPVPLVVERDAHAVSVTNRATLPVRIHLAIAGTGYALDPTDGILVVGATFIGRLSAIGPGTARVVATLTPNAGLAAPGTEAVALQLATTVRHLTTLERLADQYGPMMPLLALAALLAALSALWAVRRRRGMSDAAVARRLR